MSGHKVPVARVTPFGHELKTFSFSVANPPKDKPNAAIGVFLSSTNYTF